MVSVTPVYSIFTHVTSFLGQSHVQQNEGAGPIVITTTQDECIVKYNIGVIEDLQCALAFYCSKDFYNNMHELI